ncbi:hypothetical protein [Salmonella phage SD-15_S21]|nr:hypothetical protein [Salmonella phage SD-15_S21]
MLLHESSVCLKGKSLCCLDVNIISHRFNLSITFFFFFQTHILCRLKTLCLMLIVSHHSILSTFIFNSFFLHMNRK